MLRKIRITLAVIFWLAITMLFLDFTGTAAAWFGWMAKIQFIPAVMALNIGVLVGLIVLTLVLGRVYCSVICPLGVMQDAFAWLGRRGKKNRFKYSYSPAIPWLRILVLGIFVLCVIMGVSAAVAVLAPYSAYGRIVSNLLSPIYIGINNALASWAANHDSYAFYHTAYHPTIVWTFWVAVATLVILAVLAWFNGRNYCNTICPVGTILGYLSKYSWLKPVIDTEKCNSCGLCSRRCKASCIDSKEKQIDYTRCVACMDCISTCNKGAISYRHPAKAQTPAQADGPDSGRRSFIAGVGAIVAAAATEMKAKTIDGGLAAVTAKQAPERKERIVPPGAQSLANLNTHCTACQLCISACPNGVLRPSSDLSTLMQPESSYENGYCRPECTRCSEVCPTGAIKPLTREEKISVQIGHAVWVKANCVPLTDGVECGNCSRHCPSGAITMIPSEADNEESVKIPMVDPEKCIGCGACEYVCPSRPFSAIYVEGHRRHREI